MHGLLFIVEKFQFLRAEENFVEWIAIAQSNNLHMLLCGNSFQKHGSSLLLL